MAAQKANAVDVAHFSEKLLQATDSNDTYKASSITIEERLTLLRGEFPIDEAVFDALRKGSTFLSVEHSAMSAYSITGKVVAQSIDGVETVYFLKIAFEDHGMTMLSGEFESSKIIYGLMNDFLPKPIAFGKFKAPDPPTYFYLCEFVDMDVTVAPDPAEFTKRLAQLHRISRSPTGKFGFDVQTCDGRWVEMERATKRIVHVVIPMLLGALQAGDRILEPVIIHGDLWEGNMGINVQNGKSILFDAGSYYGHNEKLGIWRCQFSSVFRSKEYIEHYLSNYRAAEPVAEFDDRNRLYSLKNDINYSVGHPGTSLRRTAYNNMCYLCEKYDPIEGIDKYDPQIDPSVTGSYIAPHLPENLV